MKARKLISLALALILLLALFPTTATAASTLKASEATTEVERRLADLQTQKGFRPGDANSNCFTFAMSVTNKLFGIKLTDIEYHGEKERTSKGSTLALVRLGRCYKSHSGYTCKYSSSGAMELNAANVKSLLKNAKCGDIIQTTRKTQSGKSDSYANANCETRHPHTLVVQSVGENSLVTYEGNISNKVVVRSHTYEEMASTYNHTITLFRAENYDQINGGSSSSTPAASTLTISPTTQPGQNLPQGQPFYFKGSITSNYNITSATISILSPDGGTTYQTRTITPNKTTVDIATSGLDALKFGQLAPGSYFFCLTATDSYGQNASWQKGFSIAGATPTPAASTLTISPTTQPSDRMEHKTPFSFEGTITSNYDISYTYAAVKDQETGRAYLTREDSPLVTRYDIKTSILNDLRLDQFARGRYTLEVIARDVSGKEVRWQKDFSIEGATPVEPQQPTTYKVEVQCYLDGELKGTYQIPSEQGSDQEFDLRMDRNDIPSLVVMESGTWDQSYKLFFQNVQSDITAYVYYESDAENEAPPVVEPEPDSYIITFIYEDESGEMLDEDRVEVGSTTEFTLSFESKKPYYEVIRGYSEDFDCGVHKTLFKAKISDIHSDGTVHLVLRPIEQEAELADGFGNFKQINAYNSSLFYDVTSSDWFEENVRRAYELGLMKGTAQHVFNPNASITLAEAVTLAARLHKIYHTGSDTFPSYDGGEWYDPYVDYATENKILTRSYPWSRYVNKIDRATFAQILGNALPEEALSSITDISFADVDDSNYNDYIYRLGRAGIIRGVKNMYGQFDFQPYSNITRAEVAAIVTRMADPNLRN